MAETIQVFLPSETGQTNLLLDLSNGGALLDPTGSALTEIATSGTFEATIPDRTPGVIYDGLVKVSGGRLILQAFLWDGQTRLGLPPRGTSEGGGLLLVRQNS